MLNEIDGFGRHLDALRSMDEELAAADDAQRARDEVLARMHHELRTPLNAVIGFARVLESNRAGNQRPEDIRMLERVRAGGEQLLRLVETGLEEVELAQSAAPLASSEVDVAVVVARVAEQFRHRAAAKGLRLICVAPPSAPMVRLDARRFELVLQRLVDNAVKFTTAGTVRILLISDAATNVPSRVSVSDTGVGISETRLKTLFDPIKPVKGPLAHAAEGPAVGLRFARRLCHAMGCQLVAESLEGKGSRFTVVLTRGR